MPSTGQRTLTLYQKVSGVAVEVNSVASSTAGTDLLHFAKSRYETEVARGLRSGDMPNRFDSQSWTLRSAVVNPDGTITIPPGDFIQHATLTSVSFPEYSDATLTWSVYVTSIDANVGTSLRVRCQRDAATEVSSPTTSRVVPGICKYQFANNSGGSAYSQIRPIIWNDGQSAITIYPPELYIGDSAYFPVIQRFDDVVVAQSKPVRNYEEWWKRWGQDRPLRHLAEKQVTKALDSVNGASGNAGTLYAPKQLIANLATLVQGDVVGLYRGSTWREQLNPTTSIRGLSFRDVADGAAGPYKKLPVISAMDTVVNGSWTNNGDGTYTYGWTSAASVADNGYDNVYVVEVDATTEAATPIAARYRLTEVASAGAAQVLVGSAYIQNLGSNNWQATIHPSDGAAPGTRYRYEVVARYSCVAFSDYARDGEVSGLMMIGNSFGYGSLAAPQRSILDRLILLHGSTHHTVIGGGLVQRSLFYGRGDSDCIACVFYTPNGAGLSWRARQLFAFGVKFQPFYCHTSGAGNWESGDIADVAFIGGRRTTDLALEGVGIQTDYLNKLTVRRAFVDGYAIGYQPGSTADCQDSIFKNVAKVQPNGVFRNNIVKLENWADPTNVNNRGAKVTPQSGSLVEKNIFYFKYNANLPYLNSDTISGMYNGAGALTCTLRKNIWVCDGFSDPSMISVNASSVSYTSDFNVFVICNCVQDIHIFMQAPVNNQNGGDAVQLYTGQDANSLFVDLRSDPRGAKAVFMDPDSGDFRWAETAVAQKIAQYCIDNDCGPDTVISQWPQIPSVDEAAEYIHAA